MMLKYKSVVDFQEEIYGCDDCCGSICKTHFNAALDAMRESIDAVNQERERCVKVVRTATLPTIPQWVVEGGFGAEFDETIDDIVARIEDPYLP